MADEPVSAPEEKGAAPAGDQAVRSYLDQLTDTEEELAAMEQARKAKLSPKDRRFFTVMGALDAALALFICVFLVVTHAGDAFEGVDRPQNAAPDAAEEEDMGTVLSRSAFDGALSPVFRGVEFPDGISDRFRPLYSENSDTVGWLRIDGTSIDFPVLHAADNDKYHRANFYGEYDRRGSIYMDYRCFAAPGRTLSGVTILYGHHLTADTCIFADLEKYMDVAYYKTHPLIEMDTIYDDMKWKVFACFSTNIEPENDNGNVFYYWNPGIGENEMLMFAQEILTRSWFVNPAVDIAPTDRLLLLSTCTYIMGKKEARCVLAARLVREGEDPAVDTANAYQNENRRLPQVWYDQRGLTNPYQNIPTTFGINY